MEESLGGETEGTDRDNRIIGEGLIEITTEIIRKEMETGILEGRYPINEAVRK